MGHRTSESILGPLKIPMASKSEETGTGARKFQVGPAIYLALSDASLFSSSLPVLSHEKLTTNDNASGHESVDDGVANLDKLDLDVEENDLLLDAVNCTIGFVLPGDEDELFADIVNGYDFTTMANHLDDLEESDFFGGMELENDMHGSLTLGMSKLNFSEGMVGNGTTHYGPPNGVGNVAGEHPLGEHPSRTLFVRNINSNVEDSELRSLFEDNPSEKDINQGTLVVFNLDPSVSNEELRAIFGAYGEVKEVRETPHKKHHKFIEFYDVRAAEAALRALNRRDIAGKRIKLEPSRPGGTRRNLMLQMNQDLEHDESWFRHHVGSPVTNSPPVNWMQFSSPAEHSSMHTFSRSPATTTMSSTTSNHLPELASLLHSQVAGSPELAPIGKDLLRGSHVDSLLANSNSGLRTNQDCPHSFPELKLRSQLPGTLSSFAASISNGSAIETLSDTQFLWGSPTTYSDSSKIMARKSQFVGQPLMSNGNRPGFPYPSLHGHFISSTKRHQQQRQVGSAPSGVHHLERHFGFFPESPDTSYINRGGFRGIYLGPNNGSYMMNVGPRAAVHASIAGNISENNSPSFRMMASPRLCPVFLNDLYPGLGASPEFDHGHGRWVEVNTKQADSKKLFQLELEKIACGEDTRTTLMIKNIPNKYTSKILLAAIDENHKGAYDFLYLPIDFENKCNVGYAFINMLSPSHIISFYEAFNGKKWEKFNSEKVASLAYARIQGRGALIAHFQNSSLMNEDKHCHPILFHSESIEAGEQIIQEHLPSIQIRQSNESELDEFL